MNRALFITAGIVVVIAIFLSWLFLFINGAPSSTREVFSDLGIIEPVERTIDLQTDSQIGEGNVVLDLSDGELQQVTTAPIAGFGVASTTDGKQILRYVERGTGYVFEINLGSGLQTQVVPSTLAGASEAYFSADLNEVVVVTERESRKVSLLKIPTNPAADLVTIELDGGAENIQFTPDGDLVYTKNSLTRTVGYTLDIEAGTVSQRFNLTVPDATVVISENNNTFAYPKPTSIFSGALYEYRDNDLRPLSGSNLNLIPFIDGGLGIVSYLNDKKMNSYQLPQYTELPFVMLPDKCLSKTGSGKIICGTPGNGLEDKFIENWYKGLQFSNDTIWEFDLSSRNATKLLNPVESYGRQIDITKITADSTNTRILFINKIDSTLWLFKLPI